MRRVSLVVASVLCVVVLTRHWWLVHAGVWLANVRAADKITPADQLTFTVPSGWTGIIRTDMDDAWKGLHRRGFNSFVFGAPAHPLSGGAAREDPSSSRYQAWFGIYSVVLDSPDDLALDEKQLVAFSDSLLQDDQLRWLKTMGDAEPIATVTRREATGTVKFFGRDVTIFEGEVETHSDLGEPITRAGRFLGRAGDWDEKVTSHHPMSLEGFVAVFRDAEKKRLYVAWGNGVKFGDVRTWPALRDEILGMISSVKLEP
ncbi:MAG: hypothetical protein QM817_21240 [Archangium sp.]